MMETTESCVPPGFRFHPTDEELVGYYLKKKVASQKIDLDVIREIDLYRIEPWDLKDKCRIGYEEQSDWYFFSHKDKKYPTGTRTNRATVAGFWKATGRDKAVYNKNKLIGMRKTLVFYKGRAPNGQKTDWIMHEYRLESDENGPPQEEGWVVCRAFKKRTTGTGGQANKSMGGWDSAAGSYFYDEHSSVSSVVDPADPFMFSSRGAHNNIASSHNYQLLCKQETPTSHAEALRYMHSDHFVKLPQLQSPSLPLIKRPSSSMSLISSSENNNTSVNYNEEVVEQRDSDIHGRYRMKTAEKVTDWRALDKFVASQLSQEQRYDGGGDRPGGDSSFATHDLDMAAVLLMSSGVHSDNGLCLFDQRGKNQ